MQRLGVARRDGENLPIERFSLREFALPMQVQRLRQVAGRPPDMTKLTPQCAFVPRCSKATNDCRALASPPLAEIEPNHFAACYNPVYQAADDEDDLEAVND